MTDTMQPQGPVGPGTAQVPPSTDVSLPTIPKLQSPDFAKIPYGETPQGSGLVADYARGFGLAGNIYGLNNVEQYAKSMGGVFDGASAERITAIAKFAPHLSPDSVVALAASKVSDENLQNASEQIAAVQALKAWYGQYQQVYQYEQDQRAIESWQPGDQLTPQRAWQLHNAFTAIGKDTPPEIAAQQPHAPLWQQALFSTLSAPIKATVTADKEIGKVAGAIPSLLLTPNGGGVPETARLIAMGKNPAAAGMGGPSPAAWVGNQVKELFDSPNHFYRYISQVDSRYGWVKATEATAVIMAPAVLLQVLSALTGGTAEAGAIPAEGAIEEAATAALERPITAEASISAQDAVAMASDVSNASKTGTFLQKMEQYATRNDMVGGFARNYLRMVRGAGPGGAAVRGGLKGVGGIVRGYTKAMSARSFLATEASFNAAGQTFLYPGAYDVTKDGAAWAHATGKPGTFGAFLADSVGAPPGSPLHSLISGPIDFVADTVVPDPLGAYGRALATYRGKYLWQNASKAYQDLSGFRRWVNDFARADKGTIDDILKHDPRLWGIAGELQRAVAMRPGTDESRVRAILDVFEAHANAADIVATGQLPRRTYGQIMADGLPRLEFLPGVKSLERAFTAQPRYITGIGAMLHTETGEFEFGNPEAIPAIADALKSVVTDGLQDRAMVRQTINMLGHPDATPEMWMNGIGAVYKGAALQTLARELGKEIPDMTDIQRQAMMDAVGAQIDNTFGKYYGFVRERLGVTGPDSVNLTYPIDSNGNPVYTEAGKSSAIYTGQLPKGVLPKARQINQSMRAFVIAFKKGLTSQKVDDLLGAIASNAELSSEQVAEYDKVLSTLSESEFRAEMFSNKLFKATDWMNYTLNDLYFKPLALSTGGWAVRVSMSEALLNVLRQGVLDTIAAHYAAQGARKSYAVEAGKVKGLIPRVVNIPRNVTDAASAVVRVLAHSGRLESTEREEITHMTAAVMGLMAGVDANIATALGRGDLVDRAAELVTAFDGHLAPAGIRGTHMKNFTQVPMTVADAYGEGANIGAKSVEENRLFQNDIMGGRASPQDYRRFVVAEHRNALFLQEQPENVMRAYAEAMEYNGNPEVAKAAAENAARGHMLSQPEKYNANIFPRQNTLLPESYTTGSSVGDHARAVAIDHENTVLSQVDGKGQRFYNKLLAEDIANQAVPADVEEFMRRYHTSDEALANFRHQIPGDATLTTIPPEYFNLQRTDLVDPQAVTRGVQRALGKAEGASHWIQRGTGVIFDHALGPIVNRLSRDPSYLLDYANEYRKLEKFMLAPEEGAVLYRGVRVREQPDGSVRVVHDNPATRNGGLYFSDDPKEAAAYSQRAFGSPPGRVRVERIYGKTLNLKPAGLSKQQVSDWWDALPNFARRIVAPSGETPEEAAKFYLDEFNWQDHDSQGYRDLIDAMGKNGYGKVRVPEEPATRGGPLTSYIVHPAFIGKNPYREVAALTADQAQNVAMTRAFTQLSKFVHNPVDKLNFEDTLRLVAPFYFAKNQAWRRAFRLMRENPGAAEQYIRIVLAYARGISMLQQKNGSTFVGIPMTSALPKLFAPLFQQFTGGMQIPVAPIGYEANVGSAASLTPLGLEGGGTNPLISALTPSIGLPSTPLRYFETYSLRHDLWPAQTKWFADLILGPAGQSESAAESIIPNPIIRGVLYDLWGTFINQNHNNTMSYNSRFASTWVNAINFQVQGVVKKFIEQAATQYSNQTVYRAVGIKNALTWLANTVNANAMMAQADRQTTLTMGGLVGMQMLSPFGITIGQSQPKASAELQALVQKYKGDFTKAEDAFILAHPDEFELGVAQSQAPGFGNFPQTDIGANWVANNDAMAHDFPAAAVYHLPISARTAPFSEAARSLLLSSNLRQRTSQSDFYHNLLWSLGDTLYYNYFYPMEQAYYKNYSYQNYQNAQTIKNGAESLIQTALAQQSAPGVTWSPASGVARRTATMQEFLAMAKPGSGYADEPLTKALANLTNYYYQAETEKATIAASQGKSAADQWYYNSFAPGWVKTLQGLMKTGRFADGSPIVAGLRATQLKAMGAQLSYAITGVFLPLVPSVNPNGG